MKHSDFLVVGAGIVGLSIARELKLRYPKRIVTVLEKESRPGCHSSGRNSGVLHSGIYYPPNSLKAKVCGQGAREMTSFCEDNRLPLIKCGKILVTTNDNEGEQLKLLANRAKENGVFVEELDEESLKELEPEARSATGKALLIPSTSVGNSEAVMQTMVKHVADAGIEILCNSEITTVNTSQQQVLLKNGTKIAYGHVINAAGLHADSVAHQFGIGERYTLLPFKGIYWKLDPNAGFNIRHLIYPVPDLRVPFLGVHTTLSTDGVTYLGPTAVPAFGRENYRGLDGVSMKEFIRISFLLSQQFIMGRDGFRRLTLQEGRRYFKPWFAQAASDILPRLKPEHLLPTEKVGIRAQMLDKKTGLLVTDFLVESNQHSTHILNAISPAWTSAFPFARHICDNYIERS